MGTPDRWRDRGHIVERGSPQFGPTALLILLVMTGMVDHWMDRLTRSKHAEERCRARSISDRVLELVFLYGRQHRRHGADVYLLDRRGFEELSAYEDAEEVRALLPKLRAYFVISDDWTLVTAGYVIDEVSPVTAHAKRQGRAKA